MAAFPFQDPKAWQPPEFGGVVTGWGALGVNGGASVVMPGSGPPPKAFLTALISGYLTKIQNSSLLEMPQEASWSSVWGIHVQCNCTMRLRLLCIGVTSCLLSLSLRTQFNYCYSLSIPLNDTHTYTQCVSKVYGGRGRWSNTLLGGVNLSVVYPRILSLRVGWIVDCSHLSPWALHQNGGQSKARANY